MQARLRDIAILRSGRTFRRQANADIEGETAVVRMSSVNFEASLIRWDDAPRISDDVADRHLLDEGDVLVISRGQRHGAVLVQDRPGPAIADSTFHVARPDRERVVPAFLSWYLNDRFATAYLQAHARGSGVKLVTLDALGRLPVRLPPLALQRRLAEIDRLARRERELTQQIAARRSEYMRGAMRQQLRAFSS